MPDEQASGFLTELRRRNVFRAALAYLVAAWLLTQIAATVFPYIGLPDSAVTLVIALVAIGFILTLIFAWAFEITPDGIRREKDVVRTDVNVARSARKLDIVIIVMLGAALAMFGYDRFGQPYTTAPQPVATSGTLSIAVLPFENRSARDDDAFFVDGVHDDILTSLAKIGSMKVISRTSVEQFEDTELTIPEIGRMLGVTSILEGGIQRAGDRIRVNVQLIDAASDEHLWAETYDRLLTAENIFAIQSEIAGTIANELRAALTPAEESRLAVIPTGHLEAYEAYMLGSQRLQRRTSTAMREAVDYFEEAASLDPDFALAYVGLADSYSLLRSYSNMPWRELEAPARAAAKRAIELDPGLGEAWASLAYVESESRNYDEAAELFEKAITLSPNYATAYQWYGELLGNMGDRQAALRQLEKAVAIDPLSPVINFILGGRYSSVGRFAEAEAAFRKTLEIDPRFARAYMGLAVLFFSDTGQLADAAIAARHAIRLDPEIAVYHALLANIFVNMRDASSARPWLDNAIRIDPLQFNTQTVAMSLAVLVGDDAELEALAIGHLDSYPRSQFGLAMLRDLYVRTGRVQAALDEQLARNPELSPDSDMAIDWNNLSPAFGLIRTFQVIGNMDAASRIVEAVEQFTSAASELRGAPMDDVRLLALTSRVDQAIDLLEARVDSGWKHYAYYYFDHDITLDIIRESPRFEAIASRMESGIAAEREKLPALWAAEGFE